MLPPLLRVVAAWKCDNWSKKSASVIIYSSLTALEYDTHGFNGLGINLRAAAVETRERSCLAALFKKSLSLPTVREPSIGSSAIWSVPTDSRPDENPIRSPRDDIS